MKKEISNAFGNVFLTIEYDEFNKWLVNTWQGYQTQESIMEGGNACIDELVKHNCTYLLNDNREVVGPWDHATDWIASDWVPRAKAAGLTHIAHVSNPESFATKSARIVQTQNSSSFNMRIFSSMSKARNWLRRARKNTTDQN